MGTSEYETMIMPQRDPPVGPLYLDVDVDTVCSMSTVLSNWIRWLGDWSETSDSANATLGTLPESTLTGAPSIAVFMMVENIQDAVHSRPYPWSGY